MNLHWDRLGDSHETMLSVHATRRQKEVLLEYDGPAIVRLEDGANQFIGVAVDGDDDDEIIRWVQTQVSALELKALRQGAEPLRQAFVKDRLAVVDYGSN